MIKKILTLFVLIATVCGLQAQSLDRASQYVYHKRYRSAEKAFHELLKQNPENAEAWYGLTRTLILENKTSKALDTLQLAPEEIKSEPFFQVAMGTALLEDGKKEEASTYFEKALKETKEKNADILAAVAKAHILSSNGNNDYALELLNKAIKRDKHNASLFVQKGNLYRKMMNTNEAYKSYQEAISENKKYAAAYHQLGDIFLSQKNPNLYLDYFKKAITADSAYAPSIYKLYVYEFNNDPAKAMRYFNKYRENSDATIQAEYDLADLYYINKQYNKSIEKAKKIIADQNEKTQPRLYKLIGYCLAELKDTAAAIPYMHQYFNAAEDSILIAKDFESTGDFYSAIAGKEDSAMVYYQRATELEQDSATLFDDYKKLADLSKKLNDFAAQAKWLGKYYTGNDNASNVNLFNWGLAYYKAEDYVMADSVFGIYSSKYPEQGFGYYWQAKSKALQDPEMEEGVAVPAYQKLIEVLQADTSDNANNKKWMIEAYNYLAAYEVNAQKNYQEAIDYFEKVLEVDPENADAKKYITLLVKNLSDNQEEQEENKTGSN